MEMSGEKQKHYMVEVVDSRGRKEKGHRAMVMEERLVKLYMKVNKRK